MVKDLTDRQREIFEAYCQLLDAAGPRGKKPSYREVADVVGGSHVNVQRTLEVIEEKGFLEPVYEQVKAGYKVTDSGRRLKRKIRGEAAD